jgi:cell division septal protein FtsQ
MKKRKRVKKIRISYVTLWLFLIIIIILAGFKSKDYCSKIASLACFRVTVIETDKDWEERIKRIVGAQSIFSLDIEKLRKKLKARYPYLGEVRISKRFPSTLRVEIIKRIPFFQIRSDKYYIIDQDYIVMEEREFPKQGLITVEIKDIGDRLREGTQINDRRVMKAAHLIKLIGNLSQVYPNLILANKLENLSFITNDTKIILGDKDYERKLEVLVRLLEEKFNNDLSELRYIDLRYDRVYSSERK